MIERPYPVPDADTAFFWGGVDSGVLRIQTCTDCGARIFYPRAVCPTCLGDTFTWIESAGEGTIYSYTVVHRAPSGFDDDVPFAVALVDLDEGIRLMARLQTDAPRIGMRVEVEFRQTVTGVTLPFFREAVEEESRLEREAPAAPDVRKG